MVTVSSLDSESQPLLRTTIRQRKRGRGCVRLLVYSLIGFGFLIIFNLIFLPRTSISRDWRRLHTQRVTLSQLERTLLKSVKAENIREWSKKYTATPHLAGTNYELVQFTADKFEEYGIKSEIASYDIYLNYPEEHAVSLLHEDGSIKFSASLEEDVLKDDPTTGLEDRVPTFHGYSASGNVTGKVIYANYGTKKDYDLLVEKGIDFKGKIVLVKYGGLFRGLKVKFAQDLGAVGVLIYSDPIDDGSITLKNGYKAYPDGPARNPSSVQRGSVQFLSYAPGDPTTPGWASTPGAHRTDNLTTIPSIPSIPISYTDALPILKALNGHGLSPEDLGKSWAGGLDDISYNVGPSKLEVNLYNQQNYVTTPNWDVIGKIDGVIGDEAIIIGNHRDAWIAGGAGDPNSGSAALIELARAFGELLKAGWKPTRTIYLASWDGEEYGLLGSTEYGEDHAKFLGAHVAAYINVDVAASGPNFNAEASPLLNDLIRSVTKRVASPSVSKKMGINVDDDAFDEVDAIKANKISTVYDDWFGRNKAKISTLGSGSDYTVFQDFIGIPSLDFGFGSGLDDPVYHYHSNYDSFHWMDTYGDPTWQHHAAIVKLWGLATLTLAEQETLALRTHEYAQLLQNYVESLGSQIEEFPELEKEYGKLLKSLKHLIKTTKAFDAEVDALQDQFTVDFPWYKYHKKIIILAQIKIANIKLKKFERLFVHHDGLDGRNWFKHIVFAPGRYTGYAGVLLPGITEAIEDGNFPRLAKWLGITHGIIESVNGLLS